MNNCPKCSSNWIGGEIPKEIAEHYVGTHWKREIGIDGGSLGIYDGVVAYQCPDCKEYVPRGKGPLAQDMFNKFMEKTNGSV